MSQEQRSLKIDQEFAQQTVAAVVRQLYGDISWNQARAWIQSGRVEVDGTRVFDPAQRVEVDQKLDVHPRSVRVHCPPLEPERLIHVDADVVVVSKPAGIVTAPFKPKGQQKSRNPHPKNVETDTLIDRTALALRQRGGHRSQMGRGRHRDLLGIVQRLDRDTTGLLVFARTRAAREHLEMQFRKHTIQRQYYALANGPVDDGTIESHILPDRGDGLRGSYRGTGKAPAGAKRAVTHVQIEETLPTGDTLVSCHLETGRQHQIRIHLSEAGHPLIGETVYIRDFDGRGPTADRPMLHAHILGFRHPSNGRMMVFSEAMPADFQALLHRLRQAPTRR